MRNNRLAAKNKIIFLASILLSSFFFIPYEASACSCMQPPSPQEAIIQSDNVFSGKVIDIKEAHPNKPITSGIDPVAITFEIDKVWKGHDEKIIQVTTSFDSAACGFNFVLNEEYIVYTYDGLQVSLCSRTNLISNADEDLNELDVPSFSPQVSSDSTLLSPLKQFKDGRTSDEILCKEGLQLVKKSNNLPACIKPSTIEKLIERGWI